MAIIQVKFYSGCLRRTVPFIAVIPNDSPMLPGRKPEPYLENLKTLYLLHGVFGNETDFLANTRVQELSEKYSVAVIMPAGNNSFYIDDEFGIELYGQYIGKELVDYTRRLFPLSTRREDTFIGGLSMGGYGAMRNGLKYAKTFSKICAFSGAFIVLDIIDTGGKPVIDAFSNYEFQRKTFGELTMLENSDKDPRKLYLDLKESGASVPQIFMTEGSGDFLLNVNHKLRDFFEEQNANFIYIEDEGEHDWDFWNKHLEEAFQWLVSSEPKNKEEDLNDRE